jgi:UDP-3-O-[3-hydroxymyristoyl] N-acetylglucosamine deacetylase
MAISNAISNSEESLAGRGTICQQTLKTEISCTGVALHSGDTVTMTLRPAAIDTGIVFKRTDIAGAGETIPARWNYVVDSRLCTTLGNDAGITVGTVEHLMAAFAGSAIDNAVVELNGQEVPIMDGSAAPFQFLIECAGIAEQPAPRRVIRILKDVSVEDGESRASLTPASVFSIGFEIDFASAAVARQEVSVRLVNGTFKKELARARTFGFLHEVEQMRAAGLARGGSLENAVVIGDDKVLNEEGLRYDDEFVRHKALDAVGDLYLAGAPILGAFQGVRSGHGLNSCLLAALFADADSWQDDILTESGNRATPQAAWVEDGTLAAASA